MTVNLANRTSRTNINVIFGPVFNEIMIGEQKMNKTISLLVFFISGAMVGSTVHASGGGGGGYGSVQSAPRVIDQRYENGKAIYQGRSRSNPKIKYCIDNGTEKVALKGSSLKPFKKKSQRELASKLYDCNDPDVLVIDKIGGSKLGSALYYLNKRYKLKLTN